MSPWPITSSTRHPAKTVPGGSASAGGARRRAAAGAAAAETGRRRLGAAAAREAGPARRRRRRRAAAAGARGAGRGWRGRRRAGVRPGCGQLQRRRARLAPSRPARASVGASIAHAVDERPVRRPEVLDRQPPSGVAAHARVAARELRVVAEPPLSALRAPDHELVRRARAGGPVSAPTVDHTQLARGRSATGWRASRPAGSARGCGPRRRSPAAASGPPARRRPGAASREPRCRSPLTNVPFADPRSSMRQLVRSGRARGPRVAARDLGVVAEPARPPRRRRGR